MVLAIQTLHLFIQSLTYSSAQFIGLKRTPPTTFFANSCLYLRTAGVPMRLAELNGLRQLKLSNKAIRRNILPVLSIERVSKRRSNHMTGNINKTRNAIFASALAGVLLSLPQ